MVKSITVIILILPAYLIGQHFWQGKTTIEEAKQDLLNQESTSSENTQTTLIENRVEPEPQIVEQNDSQTQTQEQIADEQITSLDISDFPVGVNYGTPQPISSGSISYSDIRGLEITQTALSADLSCENITDYLEETTNGFYWWNTCREIQTDNGISLYFLGLDKETYTYEKRYFLPEQGLVWVYEMEHGETGEIEDKISYLKEKNAELKAANPEYAILDIVDNLFIEILQK